MTSGPALCRERPAVRFSKGAALSFDPRPIAALDSLAIKQRTPNSKTIGSSFQKLRQTGQVHSSGRQELDFWQRRFQGANIGRSESLRGKNLNHRRAEVPGADNFIRTECSWKHGHTILDASGEHI